METNHNVLNYFVSTFSNVFFSQLHTTNSKVGDKDLLTGIFLGGEEELDHIHW